MFVFFQPVWLLLLVPLAAATIAWPLPNRGLRILRIVVWSLAVLALAQLAVRLPDHAGTVVVVADRSDSMPKDSATAEKEVIGLLHKSMGPRDQLAVVSFGRDVVVEQSPQRNEFPGFTAEVGRDHSSLDAAIESALSLIPSDGGGRILVLSDGKWTDKNPTAAAARAAGRNVPIDYRLMTRPQGADLAIQSFLAPQSISPQQAFILNTWVQSPVDQEIRYQLRCGDDIISAGSKKVSAGLSRLMFRDRATAAGAREYTMTIEGAGNDPVPENNSARTLVTVEGVRPVLVVSTAPERSGFIKLLRSGGTDVVGKTPLQCNWSLEELSQYSAVIIENVPAGDIGMTGMETLASWVENTGSGLAMTGGQKSYGPGGYFKSPLERVMPVSMEMRREHRKLSVAVVVALDRSGSMSAPAGGGRQKIDLADLGTVQVLDLLSPMDEIGVFAVDTEAHEIVPMDSVEHNQSYRDKILHIDSLGGGIYIYEALVASAKMISTAQAQTKHIILFADASDSEQSAHYEDVVDKLREADVTVSVVGLGTDHDSDANLLKDIARRGGGECYFSADANEIPRIFAQDTFTIARSTFIDQPTPFAMTSGYGLIGAPLAGSPPALGGYNLCYIRPQANLAAVTSDEYKAPVVASWNAGNGRVLCFLGEADGKYSGDLAKWNQVGEFYATLAHWVAGKRSSLPEDMLLTQEIHDGACFVQLHLDPARKIDPFSNLPRVKILHGIPGVAPAKQTMTLQWKNADLLEAAVPIAGRETVLNTVEIQGQSPVALPPACLPYSPEFAPDQPGRGAATLDRLAMTSGGKERIDLARTWSELPVQSRYVELAPWLLVASAVLFLLEIFERRTGKLGSLFRRRDATAEEIEESTATPASRPKPFVFPALAKIVSRRKATTGPVPKPATGAESKGPTASPGSAKAESGSPIDALRKARERASRRSEKEK